MLKPIQIAIAEDHVLLREGLVSVLGGEDGFEVVFDAANGRETLEKLKNNHVDVILLDLDMPVLGGIDVLRAVQSEHPNIRCIILSMHYSRFFVLECVSMGARGFLAKHTNVEKILEALECVHRYGFYVSDDASMEFLADEIRKRKVHIPESATEDFLKKLCSGLSFDQVAEECNVTKDEIAQIWKDFLQKLYELNS